MTDQSVTAGEANASGSKAVSSGSSPDAKGLVTQDIHGHLDALRKGHFVGWAIDLKEPGRRLHVEIWNELGPVAFGEASKFRADLLKSGRQGDCGFSIPIPTSLADGQSHTLHAVVAGTRHKLIGELQFQEQIGDVSGHLGEPDGLSVRGWVASAASRRMAICILVDGEELRDIEVSPLGSGERHAFAVELPVKFADGGIHWMQLQLRDNGLVIAQSVFVTPIASTPEDALLKYAGSFPGFLSHCASRRYASLEGQFDLLTRSYRHQDGSSELSREEIWAQVGTAHRQVRRGTADQNKRPGKLRFAMSEAPDASVIIPVHNKFWVTYNCLAALLLAPNRKTFEVIVVDDGSSDLTTELSQFIEGVTICRNPSSIGFVRSSNRGAQHARADYVVMLNNDTEPCAYWLDELFHVFDTFDRVGLVGSKLVYPNGKLQEAGGIVFPNFDVWNYGRQGNPFDPRFNYTRQVDYVSGACIMLQKTTWSQLEGFDELFAPAYYEDNDLAFRVRALGLKTYYAPFSEIIHFEGVSNGTSLASGIKRYQAVNEPKFVSRWASVIRQLPGATDPDIAKDRGVQLRALVIDVQIPQPDKDAGSYAAIQEMRLLQSFGVKVTFIPMNLAYLGKYTEALQRSGIECLFAPFQTSIEQVIEARGAEFQIFYITRYSVADRYIDLIRSKSPRAAIVFNNADLHFLREIRAAIAAKNSDGLDSAIRTREVELSVMRRVDVTLTYTDTEAAVIASHNLNSTKVARCPWVVEVEEAVPAFAARRGLAFLGSFQHPPNEEAVRYFLLEIMPELRKHISGITLHVYGSNIPDDLQRLAAEDVKMEGYVQDVSEVYHKCRIFVAPLISGAGIKGKVIGALASGTPTIMTSLAGEGVGISHSVEAFIADSVDEWVRSAKSLYSDEAVWTRMSSAARAFSSVNFSRERGRERMKAALAMAGVYVS